jgi:hypothetical protein
MSISAARGVRRARRQGRRPARTVAVAACAAFALLCPAPALGTVSGAATLAPIVGSNSYLLTVTNTGSEPIAGFTVIPTAFGVASVVPVPGCQIQRWLVVQIACAVAVAPATSAQLCYSGQPGGGTPGATWAPWIGSVGFVTGDSSTVGLVPAVASCPLANLAAESGVPSSGSSSGPSAPQAASTPAPASTPGSGGVHRSHKSRAKKKKKKKKGRHARWSHARCKRTYTSWIKQHRHARHTRRKAEARKLHKRHDCATSLLR